MSSTITFESEDLRQFAKFLKSHPDVLLKNAQVATKSSLFLLERDAKINAPSGEGTLRKGIKTILKPLLGTVRAMASHSAAVHEGSRPHWPPYQPNSSLERWARKKNIPVFLVARAIARKGTKAQPFFDEAIDSNQSNVNRLFKVALDNTANQIKNNG